MIISQFRIITPEVLNSHGTLFGGTAMKWMDEVAYIVATRLTRQKMVTVSVEKIKFILPVKPHTILEIQSVVEKLNLATIKIRIELYSEEMYQEKRYKCAEAIFIFAAVSPDDKPVKLKFSGVQV